MLHDEELLEVAERKHYLSLLLAHLISEEMVP
jgi:hypothetical protein